MKLYNSNTYINTVLQISVFRMAGHFFVWISKDDQNSETNLDSTHFYSNDLNYNNMGLEYMVPKIIGKSS